MLESQLVKAEEEHGPFKMSSMLAAVYPEQDIVPTPVASLYIENPDKPSSAEHGTEATLCTLE